MIIKVCGLNDLENSLDIDKLGPDMLGMIFYKKSPRYINQTLIPNTKSDKVGVFVNSDLNEILSAVQKHQLQYVQLHGHEHLDLAQALHQNNIKVIKCFSIDKTVNMELMRPWQSYCEYFLFDTKGKHLGGNGIKFNWELLHIYTLKMPFLLSGGISLNDVEAIKKINNPAFVGVDINSNFELQPGIKNVNQIKLFIHALNR